MRLSGMILIDETRCWLARTLSWNFREKDASLSFRHRRWRRNDDESVPRRDKKTRRCHFGIGDAAEMTTRALPATPIIRLAVISATTKKKRSPK